MRRGRGRAVTQVLVCAHPWVLIQAEQFTFNADDEKTPAIYRCPICHKCKRADEPDPRVVLGKIEEDGQ